MSALANSLMQFFNAQLSEWPKLAEADQALSSIKRRIISTSAESCAILFNPSRSVSVKADISTAAIAKRPCFLCASNRESTQRELVLHPAFVALCNPMPIFRPHFTVAMQRHSAQVLPPHLLPLLDMTAALGSNYVLFFNGARAGASAPDHMHFQCCAAAELFCFIGGSEVAWSSAEVACSLTKFFGHSYIRLTGSNPSVLAKAVSELIVHFGEETFNLTCRSLGKEWELLFIPRAKHRPSCYSTDPGLLISPGAVELLGHVITVRETDYLSLQLDQFKNILNEVLLPELNIVEAVARLKTEFA